jgi:hypothetical protein
LKKFRNDRQCAITPIEIQRNFYITKTQKWNDFKERRHAAILKYLNHKRLQRGMEKLVRLQSLQFMIQTLHSKIEK